MGSINLNVHPLFFLFGMYYAFTGRIFIFIIYSACALIHELGHSFVSSNAGYRLNKITLMPFGAVAQGDIEGLRIKDEIKIALAGPMVNLAVGLFFIASWWIIPESYAFTEIVVEANLTMALINFLPIFPLDGGRVMHATLSLGFGKEKSKLICRIIGLIFALILFVFFIISCFYTFNLSLLFFSLFVLVGALDSGKENKYVRIYSSLSENKLKRGIEIKKIAISKDTTVKRILYLFDDNAVNEFHVYDKDKSSIVLSHEKIVKIIETGDLYSSISKFL